MATDPQDALRQLRAEARDGTLSRLCPSWDVELLVAFGSTVIPGWPAPPRDLDLAVMMRGDQDLLRLLDALVTHLGYDRLDLMDLSRANDVARSQALGQGELLYEAVRGTFTELEILAAVQVADTRWMRKLQLESLAQ